MRVLLGNHITAIGINTGEDYLEKKVNETHSDLFMAEIKHIYSAR